MNRRQFLQFTAALAGYSFTTKTEASTLALNIQPKLPIPSILRPNNNGKISLSIQSGVSKILPQMTTATWGYNGSLLGPAIVINKDQPIHINVKNQLKTATTIHWHGLEIPGEQDGGPQAIIKSGEQRNISFVTHQPHATCWYHPHIHKQTGEQVAMGLAGLVLIEDNSTLPFNLPNIWGVNDIPVILQDKLFNKDGSIHYHLDVMTATVGWSGDIFLTNGVIYPKHQAPKGWLRFRILNGCNARSLTIAIDDHRDLYVIGSDCGLLEAPVALKELTILSGERFEIMINASDGQYFNLVTLPVKQMGMTFAPFDKPLPFLSVEINNIIGQGRLPDKLVKYPSLPNISKLPRRKLHLTMDPKLDQAGMLALQTKHQEHPTNHRQHSATISKKIPFDLYSASKINGHAFSIKDIAFNIPLGSQEIWEVSGVGDMMLHPLHVHGTRFRILKENGQVVPEHRQGWKDIVKVEGGISEILVTFNYPATKEHSYVAHCHILEHEDTGMMLLFTVGQQYT